MSRLEYSPCFSRRTQTDRQTDTTFIHKTKKSYRIADRSRTKPVVVAASSLSKRTGSIPGTSSFINSAIRSRTHLVTLSTRYFPPYRFHIRNIRRIGNIVAFSASFVLWKHIVRVNPVDCFLTFLLIIAISVILSITIYPPLHCDRHYLAMSSRMSTEASERATRSHAAILKSARDRSFSDREVAGTLGRRRHTSAIAEAIPSVRLRSADVKVSRSR